MLVLVLVVLVMCLGVGSVMASLFSPFYGWSSK